MPRVLIVSDSHGWEEELNNITQRHKDDVDDFIHCGDSELSANARELERYKKVTGNCDMDSRFHQEINFKMDELTFFVTHGHLYQVKSTLMRLSYRAEELKANVICFGHSHIAGAETIDGKLFINPGSIRLPRIRREGTYAILSWETRENVTVTFYDLFGDVVNDLTYYTSL